MFDAGILISLLISKCLYVQVEFKDFLLPKASSKSEIKEVISSGFFPPYILYKVFCGNRVGQQTKPAVFTIGLDGENLELSFNCLIRDEMCACVCAGVRACVSACVCAYICMCTYPHRCMRAVCACAYICMCDC